MLPSDQAFNFLLFCVRNPKPCIPADPFSAKLVVIMNPMTPEQAVRAVQVTTRFHLTHGAPVHLGDPAEMEISDFQQPDFY